jgi:hypothetical protein
VAGTRSFNQEREHPEELGQPDRELPLLIITKTARKTDSLQGASNIPTTSLGLVETGSYQ